MAIPPSKNQKLSEELNDEEIKDRISKMPDSILGKVLSLLPVDEAVRTSILCTKWRYLWGLSPNIQFVMPRCNNRVEALGFMDYVDRVMGFRSGMQIQKFQFRGLRKCDNDRFYALLCTVLKCAVQILDIQICGPRRIRIELPPDMFMNYEALVAMKLSESVLLDVPAQVCLPNIKTLELKSVTYADENSVENLFSGCPVLEELLVERCLQRASDNINKYSISSTSLKRLTIFFGLESHPCFGSSCEFKLMMETPNLEYLSLSDHMSEKISMRCDLLLLDEAYIDVKNHCRRSSGEHTSAVQQLIRRTEAVKSLSLSGVTARTLIYPNIFYNLVHLSLGVDDKYGWTCLPAYLLRARNLQALVFTEGLGSWLKFNWEAPIGMPAFCMRFNLKTIKINGLSVGTKEELKVIKYLLGHAQVLSTMTISGFKAGEKIRNRLFNFRKASPSCQLIIS